MEQNANAHVAPIPALDKRRPEEFLRGLYAAHGPPLVAYVERMTRDRHQAEDVVQETLVRAWLHADTLRPDPAQVRAWLYRVARNIAVDGMRLRRAVPHEIETLAAAVATPADESDQVVATIDVTRAIDALSPEHRAILIEVYYRDRTVAQAAELLRIPRGTAKSRLFYALRVLRETICEERRR